jgi:hypothetical protein
MVLARVGAGIGVRLACQLRPIRDIAFAPMLPAHTTVAEVNRSWPAGAGHEHYLVIMFVDMRGSTRLAEGQLPFDTVSVINQFLNAVSRAVVAAGGSPNQVLGDGLLALPPPDKLPLETLRARITFGQKIENNWSILFVAISVSQNCARFCDTSLRHSSRRKFKFVRKLLVSTFLRAAFGEARESRRCRNWKRSGSK